MNNNATLLISDPVDMGDAPHRIDNKPLRECVQLALTNYFSQLEGYDPVNLYEMVLEEIEVPLFNAIMHYVNGNQSRAALLLGISRSTLRKKLHQYNIPSEKGTR
jgi:Fis family transcriptional regulator